jgi:hypothetical protein
MATPTIMMAMIMPEMPGSMYKSAVDGVCVG